MGDRGRRFPGDDAGPPPGPAGPAGHPHRESRPPGRSCQCLASGRRGLGSALPRHAPVGPVPALPARRAWARARDQVGADAHRLLHRRLAVLDVELARVPSVSPARDRGQASPGSDDSLCLEGQGLEETGEDTGRHLAPQMVGQSYLRQDLAPLAAGKAGGELHEDLCGIHLGNDRQDVRCPADRSEGGDVRIRPGRICTGSRCLSRAPDR